ncbi:MAG: BON domain-containing protein [Planctomycetes bacterium]|nr:BON domain-containing protein [Planctomycetota bacterium]
MRYLNRLLWATVIVGLSASSGFAQQGSITSGGGSSLGSLTGTGGLAGGLGGGGGAGGGGAGGGGVGALGGTALQTMQPAPQLGPPTGQNNSSLDSSNFLAGYYANPYYQGLISAQTNQGPGGFGSPLSGTGSLGGTGGARGTAGTTARASGGLATTARTTGAGAGGRAGGLGGGLGGGATNNNYGVMVPLPVPISYAAVADFNAPSVAAPQLQGDLSGMITRSLGTISNPAAVKVTIAPGNSVILRGNVANEREARLVEGMVRLTPGVGYIQNELTFPVAIPRP